MADLYVGCARSRICLLGGLGMYDAVLAHMVECSPGGICTHLNLV